MISFGVFGDGARNRIALRSGDKFFDPSPVSPLLAETSLQPLLEAGASTWTAVVKEAADADLNEIARPLEMALPCSIGDYVDFYSSIHHATRVGQIFRPNADALTPNWLHLPIGYHGRSGTVVIDGTPIVRPQGQVGPGEFGPTQRLDFELELGFLTGSADVPVRVDGAENFIFGLVLVNDWSARDIQAWEYQPLGPFLGKSFATTISPWVVPLSQLEDHRIGAPTQDPTPLPYLTPPGRGLDLELTVKVNEQTLTRSNSSNLYWTMSQQLAHATSNGATLRAGDLFASGTISGPEPGARGCLLEITSNTRYLEDGDVVTMATGIPEFGVCSGAVVPSL